MVPDNSFTATEVKMAKAKVGIWLTEDEISMQVFTVILTKINPKVTQVY